MTDVAGLRARIAHLEKELEAARALAADATEYRIPLPELGGTELLLRRQSLVHGPGWAVSTMARGGGRAWTTEGWQDAISALSVDRLFCWPDPDTAITEIRNALSRPDQ
jgi:hypothetical protein